MKEAEFCAWLEAGGAQSDAARSSRVYALKTIERKLRELGSSAADLAAAWDIDKLQQLRDRIREMRHDALTGGQDFRLLMPDSEKPQNRLANWYNWLGQYGRFLAGEAHGSARDADRIRQYVLEQYVERAREDGLDTVEVLVRTVNEALGLNQGWANICQALNGPIFQQLAQVPPPQQIGADMSSATIFRFDLASAPYAHDWAEQVLRLRYGAPNKDTDKLSGFSLPDGRHVALERKLVTAKLWLEDDGGGDPPIVASRKYDASEGRNSNLPDRLNGTPPRGMSPRRVATFAVNDVSELSSLLDWYERAPILAKGPAPITTTPGTIKPANMIRPTNIIFYGPPGTGKTFATAAEAVRLCGELVPENREALMLSYHRLSDAGRIEFVTFHQSVAYEDFVEGLRPIQESDSGRAGFHLIAEPGVFRRIAKRAETSTGSVHTPFSIGDRKVFKMSIGEASNPDDAYLFEEAISEGYTLIGFENIDWSDDRFMDRNAIIAAVKLQGKRHDRDPSVHSGSVQMPFIFRNWMSPGDIVIVSKGNRLFRAIGEVTGRYEFVPREDEEYGHRRAVHWLWVDRVGAPASEIYAHNFTMKTIYQLTDADLNKPALERYISSQQNAGSGTPESFVLIIDEINRANISKVFGELISLLEPDKRIGQPNALKVRLPYSRDVFGIPANLHIIGTMNTADRSIALLDTALRRRFEFRELMPNPDLPELREASLSCGVDLSGLLRGINERIEYLFDREHQIGHAYFLGCHSRADVDDVMRKKVIPLLSEYFYEDWAKVAAVLGDADDGEMDCEGRFLNRIRLTAPKGAAEQDHASPRFRWTVRDAFVYDKYPAS